MQDLPVYADLDVDTRIALHLGIAKWNLRYGGTVLYCECGSLDAWLEYAQRYYRRHEIHDRIVPEPTWFPRDANNDWVANHEDKLWSSVHRFIVRHDLREQFLNCMANECPAMITFAWWLVAATARQKLDIAENFLYRHLGDPLKRIDWERYTINLVTSDVTNES